MGGINYGKTLTIIRHGDYDDDHLTYLGKIQMQGLTAILDGLISGKIMILSSTAPRAKESAEILFKELSSKYLSIEMECVDILWSGNSAPLSMDNKQILRLIQKKADEQADVIIIVTHSEYADELSADLGIAFDETLEKGEMLVINMATKEYQKYSGH
jgi:phosphohistidine phosphatase SixA